LYKKAIITAWFVVIAVLAEAKQPSTEEQNKLPPSPPIHSAIYQGCVTHIIGLSKYTVGSKNTTRVLQQCAERGKLIINGLLTYLLYVKTRGSPEVSFSEVVRTGLYVGCNAGGQTLNNYSDSDVSVCAAWARIKYSDFWESYR